MYVANAGNTLSFQKACGLIVIPIAYRPRVRLRPHRLDRLCLLALLLFALAFEGISPGAAQAPAQTGLARECLRIDAGPIDGFGDAGERARKSWADTCRQALTNDAGDVHVKAATARALMSIGERAEAIKLYREMSAQNDASAYFQIYDEYKSYERSDVNKPQIVKRAEAEQALRKAAELGHAYATLMLAVLLDRGGTVKRDAAQAIYWAERAAANPAKDMLPIDMQVLLGRLLVKSNNAEDKARGIAQLERLGQRGRGDAKAYLATAIRASDPVRARALLEEGLRGYAGAVIPPLADMLIKGDGGRADPKRAVSLLTGRSASDVPGVLGARGQLYLDGKLVNRDLKEGARLLSIWARWDYDARLQLMRLLATNPELTITNPQAILYDATEAAELDEPGSEAALIELKLSQSKQFRDKLGGCALAERAAKRGDEVAARHLRECGAN